MRADEILLSDWAEQNGVNPRTAQGWAKDGKIKTSQKMVQRSMTVTRAIRSYVVRKGMKVPSGKAKPSAGLAC